VLSTQQKKSEQKAWAGLRAQGVSAELSGKTLACVQQQQA
jgi:hypothetical protein